MHFRLKTKTKTKSKIAAKINTEIGDRLYLQLIVACSNQMY